MCHCDHLDLVNCFNSPSFDLAIYASYFSLLELATFLDFQILKADAALFELLSALEPHWSRIDFSVANCVRATDFQD